MPRFSCCGCCNFLHNFHSLFECCFSFVFVFACNNHCGLSATLFLLHKLLQLFLAYLPFSLLYTVAIVVIIIAVGLCVCVIVCLFFNLQRSEIGQLHAILRHPATIIRKTMGNSNEDKQQRFFYLLPHAYRHIHFDHTHLH